MKILHLILCFLLSFQLFGQGTVTTTPAALQAGQQGKITYKSSSGSQLYNYKGDVYVHIGIVDNGTWVNVPADWNENIDKCKMVSEGENTWSVTLAPTIREWFNAASNQSVKKIGLVFRSSDGSRKGFAADQFVSVSDENLYTTLSVNPASGIIAKGAEVTFSVTATQAATLTIDINGESFSSAPGVRSFSKKWTFANGGTFTIKASAQGESQNATDEKRVFIYEPLTNKVKPAGTTDGINIGEDNSVTLVLYDKDLSGNHKDYAFLIGDFNDWKYSDAYAMFRDEEAGCWWFTLTGLNPDTEYGFQYLIGSKSEDPIRLGDPYCEKTLDPDDRYIPESVYPALRPYPYEKTNDVISLFKIRKTPYEWKVTDFKIADRNNLIIYELHLRDFTTTGDLKGAMEKLDYLQGLGINAIELMPVQEFDGNDSWGYNPRYFFAMDKAYGTVNDYKEFIDECHLRGIAVLFDVVYNHATGAHPFAKLYWNAALNKTAENNPWFNVNPPHPYDFFHDFNHESPLVRNHVKRNLTYLLDEFRVDGFRFDFTKGFTQKVTTDATQSNRDDSRIAILKDYHAAVRNSNPDAVMILEHLCDESEERILAADGMLLWRNMTGAYGQAIQGSNNSNDMTGIYANGSSMPKGSLVGYMESHDEERLMYKAKTWGSTVIKNDREIQLKRTALCAAFSMMVPGPKMIWQFGELGYDYSIEENGRVGRKPIRWDYFDDPSRRSVYDRYGELFDIRKSNPALFDENSDVTLSVNNSNLGSARRIVLRNERNQLYVFGNFSTADITTVPGFSSTGVWYELPGNQPFEVTNPTQPIPLPANGYRIFSMVPVETELPEVSRPQISVYPNPTTSFVYFTQGAEVDRAEVYNAQGILCATFNDTDRIDMRAFPAGYYLLKITDTGVSSVISLLKK